MALKMDNSISIDNKNISITKVNFKKFTAYIYVLSKKTKEIDLKQFLMDNRLNFKEIRVALKNNKSAKQHYAVVEFNNKVNRI